MRRERAILKYPRPQLMRSQWSSLDGSWECSFDETSDPGSVVWDKQIVVPFPPESKLSGLADTGFHPVVWYQCTFSVPEEWVGDRLMLHFGAVDWLAEVWLNGHRVVRHEGGHTPFAVDVTHELVEGEQRLVVRASDDPTDMSKPRGKQDWLKVPHHIWYPRTSGIWQPVWIEPVNELHITKLRFTPSLPDFAIDVEINVSQPSSDAYVEFVFEKEGERVAHDIVKLVDGHAKRSVFLQDPGIYDARNPYLWSPENPNLFDVRLQLTSDGEIVDDVESYAALRTVEARRDAFHLNGRPYFLRLVLDQGYWDESLLASPSAEALKRDVELAKAMGFNGVRKHQKIEDPRYLYWADKLGLMVWEELPSAYSFDEVTIGRLTREWLEVIERDFNHPCIVGWVCFNESWGVPDLASSGGQRDLVAAMYHLTKALDRTRPVIGNDGWEHVITDLFTVHDYATDPETLAARYSTRKAVADTGQRSLQHGRYLVLEDVDVEGLPVVLSEFGGIRFHPEQAGWGYQRVESAEELVEAYTRLVAVLSSSGLAGFCYTQFADTFQEQNGLLYSDRRPKAPLSVLSTATRGGR